MICWVLHSPGEQGSCSEDVQRHDHPSNNGHHLLWSTEARKNFLLSHISWRRSHQHCICSCTLSRWYCHGTGELQDIAHIRIWMISDSVQCSTGSLEFCCGVVSHCKNLPTSVSETRLIMAKAGRCPSIMGLRSSTTSLCHRPLRKICNTIDKLLIRWSKLKSFLVFMLVSTQLPQAVGAAYSLKMDNKDACVVAYFGDGSTSEVTLRVSLALVKGLIWFGRLIAH